MVRISIKSVLISVATLFSILSYSYADTAVVEPTNIALVKKELRHYHDSGAYYQQISSAMREAMYYLRFRINNNERLRHPKKLAVVLDIDETALTNYPDINYLNFGGTYQQIIRLESQAHDCAIPYTRTLYQFAKSHGVAVFFISGRHENMRQSTEHNLTKVGYLNWNALYLEPDNYAQPSTIPFKKAMRRQITRKGYDIILDVGDQLSDLKGGYADMDIKLPNPFYSTT